MFGRDKPQQLYPITMEQQHALRGPQYLFNVRGKDGLTNWSVFDVRDLDGNVQFLIYDEGWKYVDADDCLPSGGIVKFGY